MNHRCQLRDEIEDGTTMLKDVPCNLLRELTEDFGDGYEPAEPFFAKVKVEIRRRQAVPRVKKKINHNFFG